MVPETGLEPVRAFAQGILSPPRLPIPSLRHQIQNGSKIAKWVGDVKLGEREDCVTKGGRRD